MKYKFEDLRIGDSEELIKTFSQKDVDTFAELSGDHNHIHWDEEYAARTIFKKPIVHGALVFSHMSCLIGVHFPGPGCIVTSVNHAKFLAPVYPGDEIKATARIVALDPNKRRVVLACHVFDLTNVKDTLECEVSVTMPKSE